MLKRFIAITLAAMLFAALIPAAGATSTYLFDLESSQVYLDPDGTPSVTYNVLYNGSGTTTVTATLHDHVTGKNYDAGTYTAVAGERFKLSNGAVEIKHVGNTHQVSLRLKDSNGGHGAITFYQTLVRADDGSDGHYVLQEQATVYHNNTACTEGPAFRDLKPSMTSKWYTFVVLDLTVQGKRAFDMVASNMYVIGNVYVDVNGDNVTVTYSVLYSEDGGSTEITDEFFTFFHDLDSVTTVEPDQLKAYEFGVPYSIEKDLDGDTVVLLMVRNMVNYTTYPTISSRLTRYWRNTKGYTERRDAMMELLDSAK